VPPKHLVRVVLWMTGALLSFSVMALSVRALAGTLTVMEILALRAGLGLVVMASLALLRADLRATLSSRHLLLHAFRNSVHVGSSYLWATSLLLIPMAMTFALEFTTPAWTVLLAMPVLGERLTASRIGAVVLGLLGVLIILRPGLATVQPGALLALAAAFGFAVTLIATKKLTNTETPFAIIFWMMLIQLPLALLASNPLSLGRLDMALLPAVVGIGLSGLASHYCLTRAFRAGDAGVVVPLDFMRIPLIAVIGWWLYGEPLDGFVFLGACVILTGILWNLRSEAVRTMAPARKNENGRAA
jgi:drug/metabolite transporter (DMT)-like permease